jgi:tRNA 2-selenouridine synthase
MLVVALSGFSAMDIVVDTDAFLQHRLPTIDVRSPGEFGRGHIPGAINVPLLDDSERAEVGTLYKNVGRQQATTRGLQLVAAKSNQLIEAIKTVVTRPDLVVHCLRGGMRSQGFAWLLQQCGFQPRILAGGYKAFRQAAHRCFAQPRRIILVGGHSGTGKTRLLKVLQDEGEQVIDLEQLAHHRGSVFGGIGQPPQPTVEQFENDLFLQWRQLDPLRPVWIEGESRSIGKVILPQDLWNQLSAAPAIWVQLAREQRVEFLVSEYGGLPADELAEAIRRISKRLGGANLTAALEALQRQDLETFAGIALKYYDKAYSRSMEQRSPDRVRNVPLSSPGQPVCVKTLRQLGYDLTEPTEVASR